MLLQVARETFLCVQPEALPGLSTPGTPGPLVGACFADGGHQKRLDTDAGVVHLQEGDDGSFYELEGIGGFEMHGIETWNETCRSRSKGLHNITVEGLVQLEGRKVERGEAPRVTGLKAE